MYVRVHVKPKARKETVTKESDSEFYIAVKEPAERNMANKRVCAIIAETYGVPPGKVSILTGHRSPTKMISVDV